MSTPFWGVLLPYPVLCCMYLWSPIFSEKWVVKLVFKVAPMVLLCVWGGLMGQEVGSIADGYTVEACLFWALCCSTVGDAGLVVRRLAPLGILSFLAAQVLYISMLAKMQHAEAEWAGLVTAFILVDAALFLWLFSSLRNVEALLARRWLLLPIFLYFCSVSAMAGFAVTLLFHPETHSIPAASGAFLFWVSDHLIILGAYRMLIRMNKHNAASSEAETYRPQMDTQPASTEEATEVKTEAEAAKPPGMPELSKEDAFKRRLLQRAVMVTYYTAQVLLGLAIAWR